MFFYYGSNGSTVFFPIGEFHVVYEKPCNYLTYFAYNMEHYKLIVAFCLGIMLCDILNQFRCMLLLSTGLTLSYIIIRRITYYDIITLPMNWNVKTISVQYTHFKGEMLLSLWCALILLFSFVLFFLQRKEQKRMDILIQTKLLEQKMEEERLIQSKF